MILLLIWLSLISFFSKLCEIFLCQQLQCTAKLDQFYAIYLVLAKEMAQKLHL